MVTSPHLSQLKLCCCESPVHQEKEDERRTPTKSSVLQDSDMEGTARDVLIPPFDDEDVAALLFDCVCDVVHLVAHVFDVHLLAGPLWTVNTHH